MTDGTDTAARQEKAIGGVFPLAASAECSGRRSVLQHWSAGADSVQFFHNARSALHHVLCDAKPRRLWLPAYLCPDIVRATAGAPCSVHYYPIIVGMHPDIAFLERRIETDDAVLAINYFGRGASCAWRSFAAARSDVLWIEDCAQVIDVGPAHYGDVRLYSPRKVMGVPDGGVLVDRTGRLATAMLTDLVDDEFMAACEMRAQDPDGRDSAPWYRAFRKSEDRMTVSDWKMSETTRKALEQITVGSMSKTRRENYQHLHARLSDMACLGEPVDTWAPLCFPILSDRADDLGRSLAEQKIFCPRYWRTLTSPVEDFPHEHELSGKLIALPCDQRYGMDDMERIAKAVRSLMK